MSKQFQAIRGMNDILPADIATWQHVEALFRQIMWSYGYNEIRFPVLENTGLFKRSVGEATDIVEKEMYTFADNNGDSLSLRPEGTACCVRAGIEHGLLYNQVQRLWYLGPMFRHERPQKGRYRQFYQLGVEAFGLSGPDIDAELILLSQRLWRELGISGQLTLEINSLGTLETRQRYRKALVAYLHQHKRALDADSLRRLESNPLRILDSKNPELHTILKDAPALLDFLSAEEQAYFNKLQDYLVAAGVAYEINPRLVRGLDYYSQTVFEWVTDALGAQGTVCAGGRYDSLVEMLGGKPTSAVGFALGMERLTLLLQSQITAQTTPDVYVMAGGGAVCLMFVERLRDAFPCLRFLAHCGDGSTKSQFKKAQKSGACLALLPEGEIAAPQVTVSYLQEKKPQATMTQAQVMNLLKEVFE